MATIIAKKDAKGKNLYTAQARVTENSQLVYRKAKNFPSKQAAKDWGALQESWARENRPWDLTPSDGILYSDATERYISDMEKSPREFGPTAVYSLRRVARHPIFKYLPLNKLDSSHIMNFLLERSGEVVPASAAGDLSCIKGLIFHARIFWSLNLETGYFEEVAKKAKHLKLVGKSKEREIRPTIDQLDEILSYYDKPKKGKGNSCKNPIPMQVDTHPFF